MFASFASRLNIFKINLLKKLVKNIRGLNIYTRIFKINDDFVATLSGFIAAIVLGVISENIKIIMVNIIDPIKTLPPK